ncbi:MAG TPA: restriction endonuclease [Hyphomonas sp.]|nr:restriction endonuclease [Hyphomonas sp.]
MTKLITLMEPETWQHLEELVRDIFVECGVHAQRQAPLTLPRGSVNVDVLAEETKDGTALLTICECKNWKTNVPQEVVHSFRTVLAEAGAHRGYIISKAGFQSGAVAAAVSTNITLATFAQFQTLYFDRWILARSWQIENAVGNLHTYYEPFGIPGIMKLPTEAEREAYAAAWKQYLYLGIILPMFSPWSRTIVNAMPWPTLPLEAKRFEEQEVPLPEAFEGLDSYREFLQLLEAHAVVALTKLRSMNPLTRHLAPGAIDRDD